MPLRNYHTCRIREPNFFKKESFKTYKTGTEGLSVISAELKQTGKRKTQSYRYKRDVWENDRALKHCEQRDGKFEAAAKREKIRADHEFLHLIYAKVKKHEKWGGWSIKELIREHKILSQKLVDSSFDPLSELDCISKVYDFEDLL